MKTSLPVLQRSLDNPAHLPKYTSEADADERLLPLSSACHKSARVLAQLIQGLVHFRCLGVPDLATTSPAKLRDRAARLQKLSRALLAHLQLELRISGALPDSGLVVANHVSFADIIVLSAIHPTVFVSKSEVRAWPIVGPIAASAGTIFIQRQRRADVARANISLRRAIDAGLLVTLFPEGTSSDGQNVLPFMPSLLQPAIETGANVTPAYLRYTEKAGQRVDEVAYFGDRHLQDCLWALIERKSTQVHVCFGKSHRPGTNRKELALDLHQKVNELADSIRHSLAKIDSRSQPSLDTI